PTSHLTCKYFTRESWQVLESCPRGHAAELREIEVLGQAAPSLFALFSRRFDRIHSRERHVAQDEWHHRRWQIGTLDQAASCHCAIISDLRQHIGQGLTAE